MVRKVLIMLLLGATMVSWGKVVPSKPQDRRWVQDYANLLESDQELYLLRKLKAYYDSTSTEIVIVTERSLEGDDIFDYSYRLAESWGIGIKGKENGVLIYTAVDDRKVYIQVGYGAEGALPDIYAKRIVENQIKPNFLNEQYGKGFNEATDVIIKHLEGEFVNDDPSAGEGGIPLWVVFFVVFLLIMIFSNGGNDGRTYTYDTPRSTGGRRSTWGGGSGGWSGGGGGGFGGGFGGGSFGGGGAGGSW